MVEMPPQESASPSPDEIECALKAFREGSAAEFDELLKEKDGSGPALCSVFARMMGKTASPAIPEYVGRYRIRRVIATGGMGTVYEALQEHPRRVVALKVMKDGFASRSAMRRFEHESQILARLHHPSIAQVYEAGTESRSGGREMVPYFAMEYIPNARPVTDYAKRHKLGTHERLQLFAQVCDAVHHGHQKGIIHRDLKPGNILVDAQGQVKIIDFGVARATDSDMVMTTLQTDVGQLIGTLQYMSPEQCEADPHGLDIRSDVYGLGVVFYELLCGKRPYEFRNVAVHEAVRVIREETPARPSTINTRLRGDVETIALKAMEKDRERRYQSADEFRRDIEHYLKGEAITARPASLFYQCRVFARRNRVLVGAVAAVFVVLLGGFVVSTSLYLSAEQARAAQEQERDKARRATRRAETINEFLTGMLATVDPREAGPNVQVRDVLDRAAGAIDTELADEPEIRASLHDTVGRSYMALELFEQAEPHLRAALRLRRESYGEHHPLYAASLHQIGVLAFQQEHMKRAEKLLREAYDLRRELLGDDHVDIAESLIALARIIMLKGEYETAEEFFARALAIRRQALGEHRNVAKSLDWLAKIMVEGGRYEEGEKLLREALGIRRRLLGRNHYDVAQTLTDLGEIHWHRADYDRAARMHRERIRIYSETVGEHSHRAQNGRADLAAVLKDKGDLAEAEALYRESLGMREGSTERSHDPFKVHMYALFLREQGRYKEAEPLCREAFRSWSQSPDGSPRNNPAAAYVSHNLGALLFELGQLDEAEKLHRRAIKIWRRLFGTNNTVLSRSLIGLGQLLQAEGKYAEAEGLFRQSLEMCRDRLSDDNPKTALSRIHLAGALHAQGKPGAEEMCRRGLSQLRARLGEKHQHVVWGLNRLAHLRSDDGDVATAEDLFRQAIAIERQLPRARHPVLADCLVGLAQTLMSQGDAAAAEPLLREAVSIQEDRLPPGHRTTAVTRSVLGACLAMQGRYEAAEPLLLESYKVIKEAKLYADDQSAAALQRITQLNESRETSK